MSKAKKEIIEVQLSFTLPPPIYIDHITTAPYLVNKSIKLVKSLLIEGDTLQIEAIEGQVYNVPLSQVRYWK